jgi:Ca-activated chloride channel family protein
MKLIKVLLLSVLALGCGGSDVNPGNTFQIYLDYWNTTGNRPEIKFDELSTSKEIKIDFSKTFEGQTEGNLFTKVIIDNFKIVDNQANNYNIESIKAYEWRMSSNDWREDVEFTMNYTSSQDIGVIVLVLDRSKSLGVDFSKIQQYAQEFIEETFKTHPGVKIGIVDFSDTIGSFPISDNKDALKNYIANLQLENSTALYQGMDEGLEMLLRYPSQSRVLVTFTDGYDNLSDPRFYTLETILSKIKNDKSSNKIRPFLIALEGDGGLEKSVINTLSSNGWIVNTPKNATQVKEVFDKFGKLISNVYHLTYLRNRQVIPQNSKIKLKFEIKASK